MISINRRFINFPVSQLVLLFILFSLMIIVMIRQFWWKPLEREIKFLEKKISLYRACHQFSQMTAATQWIAPRKVQARLS